MTFTQELELDIFSQNTYRYISAKQADNITRYVKITMTANGQKIKPESGVTAYFRALKADGKSVFDNAVVNDDGTVTVKLTEQALACPGMVHADVSLMKGGEVLSTLSFYIQVEKAPVGSAVASSNEFLALVEATKKAKSATDDANAAAKAANTAASSANSAADAANAEAEHPGRIIDGTWHYWDRAKGQYVDTGIDGTVSLTIAEVITGEPGTKAKVENVGTDTDIKLKITIPRGEPGGVTAIKGNAETSYRNGKVNLTPADIGLGNVPNVATDDQTPTFTQAASRTNLTSGEKLSTLFGKIKKWFADLKNVAFTGKYSDLSDTPESLKNPNALTFTGGATGSYDGSSAMTVKIPTVPTALKNPNALTFTGSATGSYDGSAAKTVNIPTVPTALKNPNALTFTGSATGSYDGSAAKTVNIPTVPTALKNPKALTFTGGATGSYDGSAAKSVAIPGNLAALSDGVWKAGNTLTLSSLIPLSGMITSNTTTIQLLLPLGKPVASGVAASVTALKGTLRGAQGYIDGSSEINFKSGSTYTVSTVLERAAGLLRITIQKSSAFTNVANNTPVSLLTSALTVSFAAASDEPMPGAEIFGDGAGMEGPSVAGGVEYQEKGPSVAGGVEYQEKGPSMAGGVEYQEKEAETV